MTMGQKSHRGLLAAIASPVARCYPIGADGPLDMR